MIELISPRKIAKSPYRKRLADANIRGGWNYALDHAWLFEKIDMYLKERPNDTPIVIDVGCGNGMLHTFLEEELHLGIIGIDRIFGHCPYNERDRRMDLCIDFSKENKFFKNSADIVYWCSAIEHNKVPEMQECLKASLDALKPGGLFLATFNYAKATSWFEPSEAMNLCLKDAEDIFEEKFIGETDVDNMVEEYKENYFDIYDRYKKRYGMDTIKFVISGVMKIKT